MTRASVSILVLGIVLFTFAIINALTLDSFSPSLQRAEVLSCLSSIVIIGISTIWIRIEPKTTKKVDLKGQQRFEIDEILTQSTKEELAWGSYQILTATAASCILIYWNRKTILKRGLISAEDFKPGKISTNALEKQKLVVLNNTKNYPGSDEFNQVLDNLPSVVIYPLKKNGLVVVGGWSARCFTKSDEIWITGWSNKLSKILP